MEDCKVIFLINDHVDNCQHTAYDISNTCLKSNMLDLMRPYNMTKVIALEKVEKSLTTEEECRATWWIENKTILFFQFILHFICYLLSPAEFSGHENKFRQVTWAMCLNTAVQRKNKQMWNRLVIKISVTIRYETVEINVRSKAAAMGSLI